MIDHEIDEDCDCHSCALEYRNRYLANLREISSELGLPQGIGPAKGYLKRRLAKGASALEKLTSAPKAISICADFSKGTWEFKIQNGTPVFFGEYSLVRTLPTI